MMTDTPFIELNQEEIEWLGKLFCTYALKEKFREKKGKLIERFMRTRVIGIYDKGFQKKMEKNKTLKSLLDKKIIYPHKVGYKLCIRPEFLHQIYDLADSGHFELIFQMASVWIEPQFQV